MSMNIEKQIEYWSKSACEDWNVGDDLVKRDKVRHGLFFIHHPDTLEPVPSRAEARKRVEAAKGVFSWLQNQLFQ